MCGICGYYGKGDEALLKKMNDLMVHRGPDDEGVWIDQTIPIGLAMRRLSIIDLSTGAQPLFNEDKSLVIVFNGEIYNYKALKYELVKKGHRFISQSDTEVLIHGYEEYGQELPKYLNGMFAFALWDGNKKLLFCARDRIGIKPFYYFHGDGRFLFASEQKPLLTALDALPDINRKSLLRHLIIGFYTGPFTLFEDIKQLPPGNFLILENGKITQKEYWRLHSERTGFSDNENSAAELLRETLVQVVKDHMVSDVPVGLTLSGGLDSSILAAIISMQENNNNGYRRLHAYTVGFGRQSDELPYARLVSSRFPINAHEHVCNPRDAIDELSAVIWHLEEPLSNITAITAYQWAKFIARDLKVTLVGEGSDELFAGYLQYRLFGGFSGLVPSKVSQRLFRYACLQPPLGLIIRLLGGAKDVRDEAMHVYHDEYLGAFDGSSGLRGAMMFDMEHELSNNQLLRVDRMSMAHSLEARVPYLDHRLVEMIWGWPDKLKINGKTQKYILRNAYRDVLPESVINRPKVGVGGSQPIFPILFQDGLKELLTRVLTNRKFPAVDWFDPKIINGILQGRMGIYPVLGSRIRDKLLYALLVFVIWHRLFVERKIMKRSSVPGLKDLFQ